MKPNAISKEMTERADAFRKLLSKPSIRAVGKDTTIGVTKTGCVQVRRNGDVIMALTRHAFKVVLPPSEIKKLAPNASAPGDNQHMSWVPWDEVTEALVILRLKDKRTCQQVMESVYGKGKVSGSQAQYHDLKGQADKATKATKKAKGVKKSATKVKGRKKSAPAALKAKAAQA